MILGVEDVADAQVSVGGFADGGEGFGQDAVAALAELADELFLGGSAGFLGEALEFGEAGA